LPHQVLATARYYSSSPETGEEPQDGESNSNVEVRVEVVEDSEATEDEEEENNTIGSKALTAKHTKLLLMN
jgi:hypothetical protein